MASVDLGRISEFKRLLASEKDLSKITSYFLDNLGESMEFLDACEPAEIPRPLAESIVKVVKAVYGTSLQTLELCAVLGLTVLNSRLIHGSIRAKDKSGLFVWLDDLQMGIVTIGSLTTGQTHFTRISVTPAVAKDKVN